METMKYSDTAFPVHLDPGQIVAEVHANAVDLPKRTVREHIEYALDHPIGAGPIEETVQAGDKVCILISDVTRRWQQPSAYLPILVERLNRAGIPDKDILILCAKVFTILMAPVQFVIILLLSRMLPRLRAVNRASRGAQN